MTLRITDFECTCFDEAGAETNKAGESWKSLYKAPELMRGKRGTLNSDAMRSADIYSFSIVLHQLVLACAVFGLDLIEQQEEKALTSDSILGTRVRSIRQILNREICQYYHKTQSGRFSAVLEYLRLRRGT